MATSDVEVSQSLKKALFESLSAILSPQQDIRIHGEEQIKLLEVTEEFGVHLAELTVDREGPLAIRQLASLILKQYVEAHWSQHSEKFRPPEAPEAAKSEIRRMLPEGLRESISKVRSSVAYAISAIAHWDWPEAWPDLFGQLMQLLTSGENSAVHGAMRVLTEFTREVTDVQMPHVAPHILPEMYRIFTQADTYSIRTRGRAVEIFNTCTTLVHSINEYHKGAAKTLLFPVLAQFAEAFTQSLAVPDGETSDSGLKMEVIKALTTLIKCFPGHMAKWMPQILPSIWNTLTESAAIYVRTVVNDTEEADDPVDSDGEVLGFENLVFGVFDFITAMIESAKFRSTVKKSTDQLMYYVVLYMQITEEQAKNWTANPNQFVEDEDDETFSYSVRISAQDLLLQMASEFQQDSAVGIIGAVNRHLMEAEQLKTTGNINWWKVHESCLLALGSIKSLIIDKAASGKITFDMSHFLTSVLLVDLQQTVSPFLLGRALWAASRFSLAMNAELIQRFLEATVHGLHESQPPAVRISAVRAIYGFCDHLKSSNTTQILTPFLPSIMEGLIQLATQFASDVLALVIETISIVLTIDESFTATCEPKVGPLTIALFLKYSQDPLVTSLVQDIFKELCANKSCHTQLQARLLPTLMSILTASPDKLPMGLQSIALDIMCVVIRNSPVPFPGVLIQQAYPSVVHCTLKTDDNASMQSGGECVRAYISVAYDQIKGWQDDSGQGGIQYAVQVISRLLNPQTSEFTAAFVGRLVAILISKAGTSLGDDVDMMLRAVLSKMQQAESLSVVQSLVMVFAHLMHTQMDAVLEFLYNVPGPTGKPALEFVLTDWVARQNLFYGHYDSKVSIMALSKLLQHAVNTSDSRLKDIIVKGDQVFSPTEGIRTRSKAAQAPEQWTMIPIHIKIYKLLISELSNAMETNMSQQASAGGEDLEDDAWEESDEEEEDDELTATEQGLVSQLSDFTSGAGLAGYDFGECDDEEEDDPDALSDPIYQMDLQAYLTEFMQQLSQQPCHSAFISHLNDVEKHVLQSVGIVG